MSFHFIRDGKCASFSKGGNKGSTEAAFLNI